MNKVEHVANEILRGLKVQSGIDLEPDDALIVARIAISVLEDVHDDKVRRAFARWQKFKTEHQAREEVAKWDRRPAVIPNMANQPLPDYLCAAIREDDSIFPSGRYGRPAPV
jgi:hypothetical protein